MANALSKRWKRAQEYTAEQLTLIDATRGQYKVASSRGGWYDVRVILHEGKLVFAHCRCPDFGEVRLRHIPVCKHVLAAANAHRQTAQ